MGETIQSLTEDWKADMTRTRILDYGRADKSREEIRQIIEKINRVGLAGVLLSNANPER